ncbi:hypothetical protein BO78DRAFT_424482 [Aspergillus sclerotiicarbonarius CBS 121057]|uniref:Uncharacterized protein n=1 Tax=Aspergillus sclerotiicarbonarius (strain CBS 121057 / IBT 28362) TaxID=1448318 RepID=A0A319DSP4_ASPSB|nr:hypothetical protein BO78DRAFT_424482 [Aspergillus sclerotiicarbonarius CBS 121057]
MSSLNLQWNGIKESKDDAIETKVFEIVAKWLKSDELLHPLNEHAKDLYKLLGEPHYTNYDGRKSFLDVIMEIAEQIPHADRAQDRLASLFKKISQCDRVALPQGAVGTYVYCMNGFETVLKDREARERLFPAEKAHFVNSRAFIARLCANGSYEGHNWVITSMRTAFEDKERPSDEDYPFIVQGAAMFIIHAGQWVHQKIVQGKEHSWEHFRRVEEVGELYGGDSLGYKRWKFWQDGFGKAILSGDIIGAPRDHANQAYRLMVAFDSILGTK